MTKAQEQALKQMSDLAREHFDSAVISVSFEPLEVPECDRHRSEGIEHAWHGGYTSAIGLIELSKRSLMEVTKRNDQ